MGDLGVELYYMRNRWYEPRTGRFLSEDPIGLAGGINPYVYAGDDPVNRWDPRGLIAIRQCEIDGTCGREDGAAERYEDLVEETNPFDANSGGEMTGGPAGTRPAPQERGKTVCIGATLDFAFSAVTDALFFTGIGATAKWARGLAKANALWRMGGHKRAARAGAEIERRLGAHLARGGGIGQAAQAMRLGVIDAGMTGMVGSLLEDPLVAVHMAADFIPGVGSVDSFFGALGCWLR
jgi:uncharacterized protein RhaS with RHS repeats